MPDKRKKSADLQKEIKSLRRRIAELQKTTLKKKQLETLQKSDLLYRTLIENIHIGISLIDTKHRIVMTNIGQGRIFGKPRSEFVGKFCFEEFEKRSKVCPHCPGTRSMATGRPAEVKTEGVRDDGSRIAAYLQTFPVFESDGSISGFIEIAEDITEYKRTEESLKESEKRFKAIFDNTADGILLTDAKTKKFYLGNKAICKMLGYKPEELKKLTVLDITPKELWSYAKEQFGKIARGEASMVGDGSVPIKRKNGRIFYAAISAFPITFGGKTYITGVLRDVTAHKKAEEALRTSQAQLSNAMKIAKLGYWEYDVAEDMFTFNDQFYSIYHTSAEKVGGYKMSSARYARQFLHPDDVYMVEEEIKKAIKTTDPHFSRLVEHRIIYADGEIGYMAVRHFVVKDKKGRTIKTFGANQDITEYKKTQEDLRQAEAKYRTLVEQIPAVTYTSALDKTSTTIYVSPQIQQFLGFSQHEYNIDHDLWLKQLHPEDCQRVLDSLHRSHKSKQHFNCEYRMLRKDGGVVWFRDEAVVVRDNSGKPLMMQGVMFDITVQKQAEEELNMYRDKMAQTERLASLGTLSATVAHELTQPLTVIRLSIENSLEDLEQASCCKAVSDALGDALKEVVNATSAVDRFRNYARQSAGRAPCETNLEAIAGRIVRLLHKTAERARMTLNLKGLDKLPPVYSNEKDLEQMFFALTENAIHAADGKKNRRFTIEGVVKGRNIELRFSDNCSGIASENLDKIFDPFFTTGSDDGRTGLGLPIVQRIVSGFGGKIRVRSRLGKSTTFYVTLPIHPETIG
ncbi:MAG: PAS domain S-box protein [Sedimentisphaerales bacterium]|nr:PAS domain S-box protein [Sedimentisphaerales bacterium]